MYSFWLFFAACILHSTSVPDTNRTKRIVGGDFYSDLLKTPYLGFLIFKTKNNVKQGCGATILSPKYFLTAAHCIKVCNCRENVDDTDCKSCQTSPPKDCSFYTGSDVLYLNDRYRSSISKWYIHPNYKTHDTTYRCTLNNDIAIGELKDPLKFSKTINKVQLPEPIDLNQVNQSWVPTIRLAGDQTLCGVFGWGDVIGNSYDTSAFAGRQLKSLNLTLIDNDRCLGYIYASFEDFEDKRQFYPNNGFCYDSAICTVDNAFNSDSCIHDAGGPLICENTQIGIISTGINKKCAGKNNPAVYARVDIHVNWINSIVGSVSDQ